jgi:hypothetical protein
MRWRAADDSGSDGHEDLGGLRANRYAARLRWPRHDGAGRAEAEPVWRASFVFRGKRADRIKVLWWDGTGLCLYAKRLERGRFVWPLTQEGATVLTPAQLSMLCEGIDWRVPVRTDALSHGSREAPRCAG